MNKYKKYSSALRTIPTVDYKDLLIKDKSGKLKKINPLEVKYNGELVGEWAGPVLTLRQDDDGSLYYEVEIEHWTIEEDQIE